MPANRHIITLTTNNSISELMLKTNELIYDWNSYAVTNPMDSTATFESSIIVNGDIFVGIGNTSINQHVANNYSHGVVIKDILFNANTGVLDLTYNDLSTANINLDIGIQDDAFFKTVTADTFYAGNIEVTSNSDFSGNLNVTGNSFFTGDIHALANVSVLDTATFNNVTITGAVELDTDLHVTGSATIDLNLAVDGGNLTTTANTFNFLSSPTVLNIGAGSVGVYLGSLTGSTYTRHDLRVVGDVFITGQELNTTTPIFNLLNTTANTINFGGDAEEINIGSQTGTVNVRHNETIAGTLEVTGNTAITGVLLVNSGTVNTTAGSVNLFANPTSVTFASNASVVDIGSTSGITTIRNNTRAEGTFTVDGISTLTSNVAINGGNLLSTSGTFNILPDTSYINIGSTSNTGLTVVRNHLQLDKTLSALGDVNILGNLTVTGGTTTVNTSVLLVADKNIEMGVVDTPSNSTANGGGIILKGSVDKTIIWDLANGNWTSSENWNLLSGKTYKIENVDVLTSNTLGSGVITSSLTSVGIITTGHWSADTIEITRGGTNITSYTKGDVLYASADNVLSKLPIGSVDQLFQVTSDGVVHWITNLSGGDY